MTSLSALLVVDFDLGMTPGPDASSCYDSVFVSVWGVRVLAGYNVCACDPILAHASCLINTHTSDLLVSATDYM